MSWNGESADKERFLVKDIEIDFPSGRNPLRSQEVVNRFFIKIMPLLSGHKPQEKTVQTPVFSTVFKHPGLYCLREFGEEVFVGRGAFKCVISVENMGGDLYRALSDHIHPRKVSRSALSPKLAIDVAKTCPDGKVHTIKVNFGVEGNVKEPYFEIRPSVGIEHPISELELLPLEGSFVTGVLNEIIPLLAADLSKQLESGR